MLRWLIALYGLIAAAAGFGGLVVVVLFVGGWEVVPLRVDSGTPRLLGVSLLINSGLIVLFGLQHTIMARRGFKRVWTKLIPPAAERSTYVLLSGVLMCVICYSWHPLTGEIWNLENNAARFAVIGIRWFGWTLAVAAMFAINPFELLGLYHGVDLTRKSVLDIPGQVDMIFLYRRPLLEFWAESGESLGGIVRHVLIHEIGHHFGLSDEDMDAIEQSA